MSKKTYSAEEKFKILKAFEDHLYSLKEFTSIYEVSKSSIKNGNIDLKDTV